MASTLQPSNAPHCAWRLQPDSPCHRLFTLSRTAACKMIADVWRVVREWKVCFEGFGVARAEIDKAAPAFRHIDDVSTPALRKLLSQQLP